MAGDPPLALPQIEQHCLDIIRRVEQTAAVVKITRRGKVVARLAAASAPRAAPLKPWDRLRAMGGRCDLDADESVMRAEDFGALR